MPTYDASQAECLVFSFKEGVLSRVGHDVKLRVESFEVSIDEDSVAGTFDARSVRAICAMKRGRPKPGALKPKDLREIDDNVHDKILDSDRHPTVRFESDSVEQSGQTWTVRGKLTLAGETRPLLVRASRVGDRLVARVKLHTPDFGIAPFKALMGALKVKPDIEVELSVPAP